MLISIIFNFQDIVDSILILNLTFLSWLKKKKILIRYFLVSYVSNIIQQK